MKSTFDFRLFLQTRYVRNEDNKMENKSIYSDELVDVDDNGLRLKKYYFPSAKAKFVKFSDILKIEKKQPTLMSGKWRYWGTGDFVNWFPLDYNRPKRDFIFTIRLSTQKIRIGFTVENTKAFIEAVESKGIKINKNITTRFRGETKGTLEEKQRGRSVLKCITWTVFSGGFKFAT